MVEIKILRDSDEREILFRSAGIDTVGGEAAVLNEDGETLGFCLFSLRADCVCITAIEAPKIPGDAFCDGLLRAALNSARERGARTVEISGAVGERICGLSGFEALSGQGIEAFFESTRKCK